MKRIEQSKIKEFHEENPVTLIDVDPIIEGVDITTLRSEVRIKTNEEDIKDETIYSIQQAKLRTEEDLKKKLAEEKKEKVRADVEILRKKFIKLAEKNGEQDEALRVQESDFNIDPQYFDMLVNRTKDRIEQTRKEEQWEVEKNRVKLVKIQNRFYDALDFQKSTVKAIKTDSYVTTFRVPRMSEFLKDNINKFKDILESEILAKEENENQDGDLGNADADALDGETKKDKSNKTNALAAAGTTTLKGKTEAERNREQRKIARELRQKKIEKLK